MMVPFEGCCEGLLSKDHAVAALRLVEDDDPGDRATPLSGTQLATMRALLDRATRRRGPQFAALANAFGGA